MKEAKKAALEARGWRIGTATEFLGLTRDEATAVELRLKPADSAASPREAPDPDDQASPDPE